MSVVGRMAHEKMSHGPESVNKAACLEWRTCAGVTITIKAVQLRGQ